jgi:hypothetical protein
VKLNIQWVLELIVGRWRPSIATAVAKLGLGILCPSVVLVYALRCLFARQAHIITRGGLSQVFGLPAVAVSVAYACVAMIIYVHVCWEDHPYLGGVRDIARQCLLLAIIIALAATFGLALL